VFQLEYRIAVSISYVLAISFHFAANRIATFQATGGSPVVQGARYLVMAGINYLLTLLIVSLAFEYFGISVYWGALLSLVITTAFGFVVSKNWIFKYRKNHQ
jgi:putative flippase GtrA